MKASTAAGWLAGALSVVTVGLTFVLVLVLPEATRRWSALGMLAWVTTAGTVSAATIGRAGGGSFKQLALLVTAIHAWIALLFCAPIWELMILQPTGNMLTMLFPVTLPPAIRGLATLGRQPASGSPRTMLLTISGIAIAHLFYFFGRISPATGVYLISLCVVSLLAARGVNRRSPFQQEQAKAPQ